MKVFIEKIFYEILFRVAPTDKSDRIISLCYHKIIPNDALEEEVDRYTVYMEDFDAHIQAIKDAGFTVINPAELATFRGKGVIITFDDNISTHVKYALPVLEKHGVTATFFLNPAELNDDNQMWDADVETLKAAGMIIGAHNAYHRVASKMDYENFAKSVTICKNFLEGHNMDLFWAYPGGFLGSYTPRQDRLLREEGFVRFTTLEGRCLPKKLQRPQSRYVLRINSTGSYFQAILDGRMRILAKFKKGRYALKNRKFPALDASSS